MRYWLSKWVNVLLVFWVLLTVAILTNNVSFYINEFISHPQHGHFEQFDEVTSIIKTQDKVTSYRWYFYLDALWAISIILIIGNIIKGLKKDVIFRVQGMGFSLITFYIFFMFCGYFLDIVEGYRYIIFDNTGLSGIVKFKTIFYALGLLCLVYWVLKKYIIPNMRDILRFIETSLLSLLFIIIIYGLVTLMPQGGTLVVEMFYGGLNIIIFFALLTFLAIIISHFPVYVDIWRYGNNKCVKLEMPKRSIRVFGFDIIYYFPVYDDINEVQRYNRPMVKKFRRSLGILLYVAIFNIFLGVAARFFEKDFPAMGLSLLILIITLIVYNAYGKRYNNWKVSLSSENDAEIEKAVKQIVKYVRGFPYYFLICTLLVLITAAIAQFTNWNRISLLAVLITLGFQMYLYVYFKICRSYFKYVFFTPEHKKRREVLFQKTVIDLFEKYAPANHHKKKNRFQRFIATLSDNIRYLQLMRFAGIVSLITLILANFIFSFSSLLNPLNIILLYIILFYSLIIITFKHILYYHRSSNTIDEKYQKLFKYGIPSIFIILFFVASYMAGLSNDLHQLKLVKMERPVLNYENYLDQMTYESANKKQNYFFVGSYGGGLKANLWNLLLLHELEKRSKQEFLSRTVALSGVSGGAVGIGNYTSLLINFSDTTQISDRIDQIGKSNVLSNELTYLLGKDLLREFIPFTHHDGRDRSYKSMELHAKLTGMSDDYNRIGYSDYWYNIYRDRKGKFPALIMNTTSVGGKQGVASTVKFPHTAFPGAELINLFKCDTDNVNPNCFEDVFRFNCGKDSTLTNYYENNTLTYFGAVSTTNRFPFFSPTAKIKDKGSYLDGGYFENSGMLSAAEVYDAVAGDSCKKYYGKINPVFVNIINSEDYYIGQKLDEWGFDKVKLADDGEIGAIIGTLSSIDKLPRYVSEKIIARGFVIENMMMPHKISYEKVKNVLNSEVDDPIRLMDLIKVHNNTIDSALIHYKPYRYDQWGVVQPPLARLLSEPAVEYQKAMIKNHPDVQNTINRILLTYLVSEKEITKQDKDLLIRRQVSQNGGIQIYDLKELKLEPDSLKLK